MRFVATGQLLHLPRSPSPSPLRRLGPSAELAAVGPARLLWHGPPDELLDNTLEGCLCGGAHGPAAPDPGCLQGAAQHLCGSPGGRRQPAPGGEHVFPRAPVLHQEALPAVSGLLRAAPASGERPGPMDWFTCPRGMLTCHIF